MGQGGGKRWEVWSRRKRSLPWVGVLVLTANSVYFLCPPFFQKCIPQQLCLLHTYSSENFKKLGSGFAE